MKLCSSENGYLEAILILQGDKGSIRSRDLVSFMGYSRANISRAIVKLCEKGLVEMHEDMTLCLTDSGRLAAMNTHDRHCFFRKRLFELGVSEHAIEPEACQLAHAVSQSTFERIKQAHISFIAARASGDASRSY